MRTTDQDANRFLVGVDTGGTFTDFVLVDGDRVRTWKLPSTPDDPSRAVLTGIRHLLGDRETLVFHGSTVATNALLEGKGAAAALVVTRWGDFVANIEEGLRRAEPAETISHDEAKRLILV